MVYFIQQGSNVIGEGPIKIGKSEDPVKRLVVLRREGRKPLYLLWATPILDEAWHHHRFDAYRIARTEWFMPGPELVEQLQRCHRETMMAAQGRKVDGDYIDETISVAVEPEFAAQVVESWRGYEERLRRKGLRCG